MIAFKMTKKKNTSADFMHLIALSQIRFPCNNYTCHYSEYSLNFSCVGIQEHFVEAASGMIRAIDYYTVLVEPCLVSLFLFCWIIGSFWWLLFLCRPPEDSLRPSASEVTTHVQITVSRRLGRSQIRTRDLGTDSRIQGFHWHLGTPAERPKAQYNVNFNISHFTLHILIRKKEASDFISIPLWHHGRWNLTPVCVPFLQVAPV